MVSVVVTVALAIILFKEIPERSVWSIPVKQSDEHIFAVPASKSNIDRVILNTTLAAIENINLQIDTISKELAWYAWDSEDVKILLSMTGIDMFSAMLIAVEIVDVKRFSRLVHQNDFRVFHSPFWSIISGTVNINEVD